MAVQTMKYLYLFVTCMLVSTVLCSAQQDSIVPFEKAYKRGYTISKVAGIKPVMDGRLDDDFWTKQGE